MAPFPVEDPWEFKVRDNQYKGFKLGSFHMPSERNVRALLFFLPDFGVTARSFGSFFEGFSKDSGLMMRTYGLDRRGFGKSQSERGLLQVDERAFEDIWDFTDSVGTLRGYPASIPKVLVSHGLGSLYAAHLCAQKPRYFAASVSIAPWLGLQSRPSDLTLTMMKAKLFMPRARSYNSQDLVWRDKYLTEEFKNSIAIEDKLFLYDRLTKQSQVNLIQLLDLLQSQEEKTLEKIIDPQLVILPERASPLIGNAGAEEFFS